MSVSAARMQPPEEIFGEDAFSRLDESDDSLFYARERMVQHLDADALATVAWLIGRLVVEERPAVLDLMASWDSHLPEALVPAEVVGLGLNEGELKKNPALTRRLLHDLNREPRLPFADDSFDCVLCTVSVDYLVRPFEVFAEAGRVLKPGGLLLVIFSNRMFPQKAVRVWREATEAERVLLVEDYIRCSGPFGPSSLFVSKGRSTQNDQYAASGAPGDPVYAVYAEKAGGDPARPARPCLVDDRHAMPPAHLVDERKRRACETLECPYCGERMLKWTVPQTPFTEWDRDVMHVCFNDECPYYQRGWGAMSAQGICGFSYRVLFDRASGSFHCMPVHSSRALRENIVEE